MVYVDDVAHAFVQALLTPVQGAPVYNMVGQTASMDAVMAEIRRLVPAARLRAEGKPLTVADGIGEDGLDAFLPGRRKTTLAQGIAATVQHYGR
jgi:UDP-glucose 4-epimerase